MFNKFAISSYASWVHYKVTWRRWYKHHGRNFKMTWFRWNQWKIYIKNTPSTWSVWNSFVCWIEAAAIFMIVWKMCSCLFWDFASKFPCFFSFWCIFPFFLKLFLGNLHWRVIFCCSFLTNLPFLAIYKEKHGVATIMGFILIRNTKNCSKSKPTSLIKSNLSFMPAQKCLVVAIKSRLMNSFTWSILMAIIMTPNQFFFHLFNVKKSIIF